MKIDIFLIMKYFQNINYLLHFTIFLLIAEVIKAFFLYNESDFGLDTSLFEFLCETMY